MRYQTCSCEALNALSSCIAVCESLLDCLGGGDDHPRLPNSSPDLLALVAVQVESEAAVVVGVVVTCEDYEICLAFASHLGAPCLALRQLEVTY